jgi:hypothetical protein
MQLRLKLRVSLSDVFARGAFTDDVFKQDMESWFYRAMPRFQMPMLGETNVERWAITPPKRHEARLVDVERWLCPSCEDSHADQGDRCCFDDEGAVGNLLPLTKKSSQYWVVIDNDTGEWARWDLDYVRSNIPNGVCQDHEILHDGLDDVYAWESESEVADVVRWLDREYQSEHGHEDMNAFPWSQRTGYLPEVWVEEESLLEAGFTVATYTTSEGYQYRIAGLDGGGYSSDGHFVRLFAHYCIKRGVTVHTKDGYAEMMPEGAA